MIWPLLFQLRKVTMGTSAPPALLLATAFSFCLTSVGCGPGAYEQAQAQVRRIAATLDQQTTDSGVYVRAKNGELKEIDPWGTPVQVGYSQGGLAEMIDVRSAGPDVQFHTNDDVVARAISANLKGVGAGLKQSAEEVATGAVKGIVKGAVAGVKESLPFRKKQPEKPAAKADEAEPAN